MMRLAFAAYIFILGMGFTSAYPINQALKSDDGCVCEKFSCGCCLYMDVPQIWLNDTACINFAYEPDVYGISFVVTIDDKALINETISARNPPPICFPVPYIEDFIDGCVHFTDLNIHNTSFHGCVQLELRMWWVYVVAEVSLGCFDTLKLQKGLVGLPALNRKSIKGHEVVFSNMTVDDKYKYKVVPLKDGLDNDTFNFISNIEMKDNQSKAVFTADKVNSANVVCVNGMCSAKNAVCLNGICTIPFNMGTDSDDNQTDLTTPANIKEEWRQNFSKDSPFSKANSVNFSSILFMLVLIKAWMSMINFN